MTGVSVIVLAVVFAVVHCGVWKYGVFYPYSVMVQPIGRPPVRRISLHSNN